MLIIMNIGRREKMLINTTVRHIQKKRNELNIKKKRIYTIYKTMQWIWIQ